MNPEDRLSDLPDGILYHILSFVPTKHAVTTSALSKRWKDLFLGLTNIHIEGHFFLSLEDLFLGGKDASSMGESVVHFVNRRLALCEATPISEFRFKCQGLPEPPHVMSSWFTSLLSNRIKVLEVEAPFFFQAQEFPPAGIFQSPTLEMLRLRGEGIAFRIPDSAWVPNLKVLYLEGVEMRSESDNYRFTHETYPLLEELILVGISFPIFISSSVLQISSDTLRKVKICIGDHELSKFDLNTPDLQHLQLQFREDLEPEEWLTPELQISTCKFELLVSADLTPFRSDQCYNIEVLSNIRNVKQLHLTGGCRNLDIPLPQFPNLTHLELTDIEVKSMWRLLQQASNLESFVYHMVANDASIFLPHEDVPLCLAQSLLQIKLCNFTTYCERMDGLKLLRYFLRNGAVLEKMTVEHSGHVRIRRLSILQKFGLYAPKCELVFQEATEDDH